MNNINCSAWSPGLESGTPPEFLKLETICRPENVSTLMVDVDEISTLTGLSVQELVAFKAERLVLHELIVRVTANIAVLEGEEEEDLGKNFRQIANKILVDYIQPHMVEINQAHSDLYDHVYTLLQQELSDTLFHTPDAEPRKKRYFLFRRKPRQSPGCSESIQEKEYRVVSAYKQKGLAVDDPLKKAIYKSLYRVLGSTASTRGYIGTDKQFLTGLVSNHVCNSYGSKMIGDKIAPYIAAAIQQEGFTSIQCTEFPILISLKALLQRVKARYDPC